MVRALVAIALLLLPASALANWQEASSKHFLVYADDTPAKVLAFTTRLERADKAMRVLRGTADPAISSNSRVTVYVVRNLDTIHRLYGKGGGDVAGFYDPRASGSVAFVPRRGSGSESYDLSPTQVLFHEYAHHFMYANAGDAVYPGWLVEGFAEFHATTRVADDGSVVIGDVPLYRVRGILNNDLPLRTLLTATPQSLPARDRDSFYGRGWLLTHYLTMDEQRRPQLTRYLAALKKGESPIEAAKVFGSLSDLDGKLNAYTRSRLNAFKIPASRVSIDPVTVRPLSAGEAAIMPARIASSRGVDAKTSAEVAARARSLAAPFPNDGAVQNELAEAELDAGHQAAALAAAERALAADPRSIHAMMYAGLARMAAAAKQDHADPAAWEAARAWFRRANHADPEYAWPLAMYYASYVAAKVAPTRNAQDGLLYARALAPFDPGLGMTAAHIYLQRDDAKEAARMLEPIAYNPHGGELASTAQAVLGVLNQQGVKPALAALDRTKHQEQAAGDAAPPALNLPALGLPALSLPALSPPVRPARSARAR